MSFPAADYYGHPRVSQKLHPHNILKDKQAFLVGMLMRFPIDLSIVVGHPAMIGTGPIGGKAVETGLVIAGRDPVAVDSVGAYLLGFETLGVQHLHQAYQLGLGTPFSDPEKEGESGPVEGQGRLGQGGGRRSSARPLTGRHSEMSTAHSRDRATSGSEASSAGPGRSPATWPISGRRWSTSSSRASRGRATATGS